MALYALVYDTSTGQFRRGSAAGSGTAGQDLVAARVLCVKAADGKLWKHDGTEAFAQAIVGVSKGTYATSATASYWKTGDIVPDLVGFTQADELFADDDGTMVTWASIGAGKSTRSLGVVLAGGTSLLLQIGPVLKKMP